MLVDLIVNPTARRYERAPSLVAELREVARGHARIHTTQDLGELGYACRLAAEAKSELVILTGGDGSLMAGTTEIAKAFGDKLPKIGFLPAGTAAIVSKNWGLYGEPAALLKHILEKKHNLATKSRPTLRVVAETSHGVEERVGFIFGTGLVAKFFDVYYEDGARGNAGAARIVARVFAESFVGGKYARRVLDPLPCTIEVDGHVLTPRAFSLVCAAVVRDLGLHMHVTHRAGEDPNRPHLVVNALPSRQLGWRMPLVLAGRPIGGRDSFDDLINRFTVRFPHDRHGNARGPYVLDGDMFYASELHVSAGPLLSVVST